jgi:hypothetical protein
MKRVTLNFIVDLFSFIALLGLVCTGVIIKSVLPPGTGGRGRELHGGRGTEEVKSLLSMTRHEWGDIHFIIAVIFVVLMLVHLVLHWTWLKCYFKSLFSFSRKKCENLENPQSKSEG